MHNIIKQHNNANCSGSCKQLISSFDNDNELLEVTKILPLAQNCRCFEADEKEHLLSLLLKIEQIFHSPDIYDLTVDRLVGTIYGSPDDFENDPYLVMEQQGYEFLRYSIDAKQKIKGLKYGLDISLFIEFAYKLDEKGCLVELLCSNVVTDSEGE